MLWVPYLLLIFLGLFCDVFQLYDYIVILFMGLLAWLNTSAADYSSVYLAAYLNPFGIYDMDLGWSWLNYLGANLGLAYNGFACVVTIVAMILYREFGKRVGANTSLMLALFLIYPGLMSLVQFRQFVACAVGCMAVACLWTSHWKYRHLIFAALMALAFLLHRSSIVLLFALVPSFLALTGKRGRVVVVLLLVALGFVLFVNWESLCVQVFGETKTTTYLSSSAGKTAVSSLGGLRNICLLVLMAIIPFLCCSYMARVEGTREKGLFEWGLGKPVLGILFLNFVLLVLAPVVLLTNDFMRFERYGITLALALFSMMPSLRQRSVVLSCKAFYVVVCIFFAYFYVANTFDSVYTPLLNPETIPAFFAL